MSESSDSSMPPEVKKQVQDTVKGIVASMAISGVIAASATLITMLTVSNLRKESLSGTKTVKPTEDEVVLDKKEAADRYKVTAPVIRKFEEDGILVQESRIQYRNPFEGHFEQKEGTVLLTEEQQAAVDGIFSEY